jgi:mannose-6-phosphate isomerase
MDLLRFEEAYMERIWGGDKLRTVFGKPIPEGKIIGEAWIVSDHPQHESVVADGPFQGRTLRELLEENASAVLGSGARLTAHGRFPLLLKLIDAGDVLSVQVHPDDNDAHRLGEPDAGKTEMWHVMHAEPESTLICGLDPAASKEEFSAAIAKNGAEGIMTRFPAPTGTDVFVPAGTVHAIGGGLVLAEIQQNSDLTYRVYDWGRTDGHGRPRALHVQKAMEVTHFGSAHTGPNRPLSYAAPGATCSVLAACRHFAVERIQTFGSFSRTMSGKSFHLLLVTQGPVIIRGKDTEYRVRVGEAVMVPGSLNAYHVTGAGAFLDYYVPNLQHDILTPLMEAGHSLESIIRLGGTPDESDLATL